jgi:hypothetical protein
LTIQLGHASWQGIGVVELFLFLCNAKELAFRDTLLTRRIPILSSCHQCWCCPARARSPSLAYPAGFRAKRCQWCRDAFRAVRAVWQLMFFAGCWLFVAVAIGYFTLVGVCLFACLLALGLLLCCWLLLICFWGWGRFWCGSFWRPSSTRRLTFPMQLVRFFRFLEFQAVRCDLACSCCALQPRSRL